MAAMNITTKKTGKPVETTGAIAKPVESQISRFRRELEDAFDRAFRGFDLRDPWRAFEVGLPWPPADVSETDKEFAVRLDVPGLKAEDLNVELTDESLTIRGERTEESEREGNGDTYRHERYSGSFARTITIPAYADTAKAEAKYDKGVLTITLPKVPGQGPKRVAVKTTAD
jgi:HSP20 family protein